MTTIPPSEKQAQETGQILICGFQNVASFNKNLSDILMILLPSNDSEISNGQILVVATVLVDTSITIIYCCLQLTCETETTALIRNLCECWELVREPVM